LSPLVSSNPEQTSQRTPPNLDPDSWESTKQVEEFNRRVRDFEIEFTDAVRTFYYEAKDSEVPPERRHMFQGTPRTNFPNRYSFAYTAYQRARISGASLQTIFDRVNEVWIYVQQAYSAKLVKPGSAPLTRIDQLVNENNQLKDQVNELTKKIAQKDYIITHLGGRQEGEVTGP
jgi:hypothetical protein